jgi:hypothetical protein
VSWTSGINVNFQRNPMVFNSMSSELFFTYLVRGTHTHTCLLPADVAA